MILIKFLIYFTLSFVLLSIPIQKETAFSYLSKWTTPYTKDFHSAVSENIEDSIDLVQNYYQKLFSNSSPKQEARAIAAKNNKSIKTEDREDSSEIEDNDFTDQERELLRRILKETD